MSKNDGGPAFPSHGSMGEVAHEGMTLRDYFAAHAPYPPVDWGDALGAEGTYTTAANAISIWNYRYADAMIAERARVRGKE